MVSSLGKNFKNGIASWCNVKIKKIKMGGSKTKKVKDHKFDAGKCQTTFHKIVDKIDEIIVEMIQYKTEAQIQSIVDSSITDAINSHTGNQFAHHGQAGHENAGGAGGTPPPSDRRLKTDISIIGKSPSGLNIYTFRFTDKKYGSGLYQGVMSDEIPQSVVIKDSDGYDRVDYNKIDVDFVQVNKI